MRGASSRPRFGPPKEISSYTPDRKTSGRFNPQPEADSNTLLRFFGSLRLTTAAIHAAGQEEFPRLREIQGPVNSPSERDLDAWLATWFWSGTDLPVQRLCRNVIFGQCLGFRLSASLVRPQPFCAPDGAFIWRRARLSVRCSFHRPVEV